MNPAELAATEALYEKLSHSTKKIMFPDLLAYLTHRVPTPLLLYFCRAVSRVNCLYYLIKICLSRPEKMIYSGECLLCMHKDRS